MSVDTVICPGCGWVGTIKTLKKNERAGVCPSCDYENGVKPYRLLTIREMLKSDIEYNDVNMKAFLSSLMNVLGIE